MDTEKNKAPEITIPEGFHPPEGKEGSKTFEEVCTFEVKPDGKSMCMTRLGDHKFDKPDYDEHEKAPNYDEMSHGIASQMAGAGAGQGY